MIIIVGKGGTGKTYFTKILGLHQPSSMTTRPPRAHELEGIDYHFVTKEEILSINEEELLDRVTYNGNIYAIRLADIHPNDVLILTPAGIDQAINKKNIIDMENIQEIKILYLKANIFKRFYRIFKREISVENNKTLSIHIIWNSIIKTCRKIVTDMKVFWCFSKKADIILKS